MTLLIGCVILCLASLVAVYDLNRVTLEAERAFEKDASVPSMLAGGLCGNLGSELALFSPLSTDEASMTVVSRQDQIRALQIQPLTAVPLLTHIGDTVQADAFVGKPLAVFFGFTHCPDACPVTMAELDGYIRELGAVADQMNFAFVTVDPVRDTPDALAAYVESFDPRIIGLTGTQDAIDALVERFGVYAKKVDLGGGEYSMDHSAGLYLVDASGVLNGIVNYGEHPGVALGQIRALLKSG